MDFHAGSVHDSKFTAANFIELNPKHKIKPAVRMHNRTRIACIKMDSDFHAEDDYLLSAFVCSYGL